jgi:hypothetical protein
MGDHADGTRAARLIDRYGLSARARRRCARVVGALVLAGSALVVATAGPAAADDITGGCTGTINGRDASTLTTSDPLSVQEGDVIAVAGDIPPDAVKQNPNSYTTVTVDLLADVVGVHTEEHKSIGAKYESDAIEVDDYLRYGAGLYQVHVTNQGPGWTCTYTGYVKMDASPLSKPIGIAAVASLVIGAVGVVLAKGRPRRPRRDWFDQLLSDEERAARDDTLRAAHDADPGLRMAEEVRYAPIGPPWILATLTVPLAVMPVVGTGTGGGVPAATRRDVVWQQFVWKRGHAVWGFVVGGLLGVGIGVLGWQYGWWLLTVWTAFVVPIAVAVGAAVYAWSGRRYVGRVTAPTAPTPTEPTDTDG